LKERIIRWLIGANVTPVVHVVRKLFWKVGAQLPDTDSPPFSQSEFISPLAGHSKCPTAETANHLLDAYFTPVHPTFQVLGELNVLLEIMEEEQ
jgi:hypothetical protein